MLTAKAELLLTSVRVVACFIGAGDTGFACPCLAPNENVD